MHPETCHRCGSKRIWMNRQQSQIVYDLKFTRGGIKRWAVRYRYNNVSMLRNAAQSNDHLFTGSTVRPESASFCHLSLDRITPLESKGEPNIVSSLFDIRLDKHEAYRNQVCNG